MGSHHQWTGKPKVGYATPEEAETHRQELEVKTGADIETYPCWCKNYHVGHKPKPSIIRRYERSLIGREEALVGKLIGALKTVINK